MANRETEFFAGVIYGQGSKITNTGDGIEFIEQKLEAKGIFYFGDIDVKGLEIPRQINSNRRKKGLFRIIACLFFL